MPADALKKLHTALVDTRKGYEEAIKNTDDPQVAKMSQEMVALRSLDHEELHKLLVDAGEEPDDAGSFMGAVHETVVNVRAAVTGLGKNAMSSFVSGEENLIETYDEAIKEQSSGISQQVLKIQRQNVLRKIEQMKVLENQS